MFFQIIANYAKDVNEVREFIKKEFSGVYTSIVFAPRIAGFNLD